MELEILNCFTQLFTYRKAVDTSFIKHIVIQTRNHQSQRPIVSSIRLKKELNGINPLSFYRKRVHLNFFCPKLNFGQI